MAPIPAAVSAELGAKHIWDLIWGELERLVAELNRTLGAHLRERPIAAWCGRRRGSLAGGVLVVGRTHLDLELDLDVEAPPLLHSAAAALRLTAFARQPRRAIAVLWVDPTTRSWTSTEMECELFPLDDRLALERFFLALFVNGDGRAPTADSSRDFAAEDE